MKRSGKQEKGSELIRAFVFRNRRKRRHTYYTCPDCGGGLREMREGQVVRYSCHIRHTFTENELATGQGQKAEEMDLHIERLKEFIFSYQRTEKR